MISDLFILILWNGIFLFYEWLNSPIVYVKKGNFIKQLKGLRPKFYSPISCLHHYLSMAKGNYKTYLTDKKAKIKKYFYVLRPILACIWIEKNQTMPPMGFEKLFREQPLDPKLTGTIRQLLKRKRLGRESDLEDKIEILCNFLKEKIAYFENYAKTFKPKKIIDVDYFLEDSKIEDDSLDNLFMEIVLTSTGTPSEAWDRRKLLDKKSQNWYR